MLDVALLAGNIVSAFLVPMASDGWQALRARLAEQAGEVAGDEAADVLRRAWRRVRNAFAVAPGGTEKLDAFEDSSGKEHVDDVRALLEDLLRSDEGLRDELLALSKATTSSGQQVMTLIGNTVGVVNVSHSHVEGDITGVRVEGRPRDDR